MVETTYAEMSSNGRDMMNDLANSDPSYHLYDSISDDQAKERLTDIYGDDTERFIELYKEAYPTHKLCEALHLSTMVCFQKDK